MNTNLVVICVGFLVAAIVMGAYASICSEEPANKPSTLPGKIVAVDSPNGKIQVYSTAD